METEIQKRILAVIEDIYSWAETFISEASFEAGMKNVSKYTNKISGVLRVANELGLITAEQALDATEICEKSLRRLAKLKTYLL